MSELEKYERINTAETAEELESAILSIADEDGIVQGRIKSFDAKKQANNVKSVIAGYAANRLTRSYGIRQQALYIKHYGE